MKRKCVINGISDVKKNNKKGFTLIELLSTIVVSAIIALIITPSVLRVIEKSRYNTFKNSVLGLLKSSDLFIANEAYDRDQELKFVCDGTSCTSSDGKDLSINGEPPTSGSVDVKDEESRANRIEKDGYCALGTKANLDIKKDCDKLDDTIADIDQDDLRVSTTTNSIIVDLLVMDIESGIKSIEYYIDGNFDDKEEYDNYFLEDSTKENKTILNTNHTFKNLKSGKVYKIKIKVTNGNNRVSEIEFEARTEELKNPKVTFTSVPDSEQNGYYKSQSLNIEFYDTNITNPEYFIKSTREVTIPSTSLQACGNSTNPESCGQASDVTRLQANTWYKVNKNINITYDEASKEVGTLYALTYDGVNYSVASTGTLSKIDTTLDTLTLENAITTRTSITVPIIFRDDESGIGSITSCKTGNINGTVTGTTSCKFTGLTENTPYTYEVCGRDLVGNSKCVTGNATTGTITGGITVVNTPATEQNGYYKSQALTATFSKSNLTNSGYYIYSSVNVKIPSTLLQACGTESIPGSCNTASNATELQAGYWYRLANTSSITVTYNEARDTNAYFYAAVYDGETYVTSDTYTLSKIDSTLETLILGTASTTKTSITIPVTIRDNKSGIGNITSCKTGSINGVITGTTSCKFTGLTENTQYTYEVCGSDLAGNTKCVDGTATTGTITGGITASNTPSTEQKGYYKSQVLTATFSKSNVTNSGYYIKSSVNVKIPSTSLQVCGTGSTPGNCNNASNVTELQAGYWYRLANTSSITVTYDEARETSAYFYAAVYDGETYVTSDTYTLSKIDNILDTLTLGTASTTRTSITIPITLSDSKSGIGSITSCKTGNTNGVITGTTSCKISGLTANTQYTYEVCGTDAVGNSKCVKENATTGTISGGITASNTPSTEQNGYYKSQVLTATFSKSNLTNSGYYIYATRNGSISSTSLQTCGTGNAPGSCGNASNLTTLTAGYWYKLQGTASSISVTFDSASTTNAYFYAAVYDGETYVTSDTYTLSKIDKSAPKNVTINPVLINSGRIDVTVSANDVESGIAKYIIYYGTSSTALSSSTTIETTDTSTTKTLNLSIGTTYYFKVTAYDAVGNYADSSVSTGIKTCTWTTSYSSSCRGYTTTTYYGTYGSTYTGTYDRGYTTYYTTFEMMQKTYWTELFTVVGSTCGSFMTTRSSCRMIGDVRATTCTYYSGMRTECMPATSQSYRVKSNEIWVTTSYLKSDWLGYTTVTQVVPNVVPVYTTNYCTSSTTYSTYSVCR